MGKRSVHVLVDQPVLLVEDGVTLGEKEANKLRGSRGDGEGREGEGGRRGEREGGRG